MNKIVTGGSPGLLPEKRRIWRSSASKLTITGILCLFSSGVLAEGWDFSPSISITEQFTDNARSAGTNGDNDFITTVDLGFTLSGETRRSRLRTSYDLSKDYYVDNTDLDGIRHNFLGDGSLELLDDKLFIDARVTFTEETLDRSGSTSATGRTQSSDRTQVFNGQISPYYVHDFSGWATGIARYSYSETLFSEPDTGGTSSSEADRRTNEYRLNLNSGRRFARASWGLETGLISSESDDGDEFDHLNGVATGQVPLNRYFSIIGTAGYDAFDVSDIDDDEISGLFGGAGIRFHPSTRTDASIQIGHRFGDPVLDVDISYAPTSADTLTATYRVSVQTADQSLANTRLLDRQGELIKPNFTVTDYVDEVTKSSRLTVDWQRDRGRNTYGISGQLITRDFLVDDSSDTVLDLRLNFSRSLTPRADLSLTTSYSEVLDGRTANSEDTTYRFGANYQYRFGRGLTGRVSYNFLNRDEPGEDLRENALSVSISKNF